MYEAAFTRSGLARVRTLEDFFDCAELLAKQSPPSGRRLVVVTNSGGPGVMAADAVAEHGLELSSLNEKTIDRLNEILPAYWSHGNPIDILGDATAERYAQVTNCCFETESVDGMLVIVNSQAMTDPTAVAETLSKDLKGKPYPVFTAMMGGMDVEEGRAILNKTGIPTYATPERAIRSFRRCYMIMPAISSCSRRFLQSFLGMWRSRESAGKRALVDKRFGREKCIHGRG